MTQQNYEMKSSVIREKFISIKKLNSNALQRRLSISWSNFVVLRGRVDASSKGEVIQGVLQSIADIDSYQLTRLVVRLLAPQYAFILYGSYIGKERIA
jgi:hypothetical protein